MPQDKIYVVQTGEGSTRICRDKATAEKVRDYLHDGEKVRYSHVFVMYVHHSEYKDVIFTGVEELTTALTTDKD